MQEAFFGKYQKYWKLEWALLETSFKILFFFNVSFVILILYHLELAEILVKRSIGDRNYAHSCVNQKKIYGVTV